jgi:hypothetical protein
MDGGEGQGRAAAQPPRWQEAGEYGTDRGEYGTDRGRRDSDEASLQMGLGLVPATGGVVQVNASNLVHCPNQRATLMLSVELTLTITMGKNSALSRNGEPALSD